MTRGISVLDPEFPTCAEWCQVQGRSAPCGHGRFEQLSTICPSNRRGRSKDIPTCLASFVFGWVL